ncbi:MAG: hypothetical protein ABSA05_15950 [Opitutaceae bacterium]|jgi:hypothetical protein
MPVIASFGPSFYVHEIIIRTQNNRVIRLWFEDHKTQFEMSGSSFEPGNGLAAIDLRAYHGRDPKQLHDQILTKLINALGGQNNQITEIDNPCNAPFVPIEHQKSFAAKAGASYILKLNGAVV